jgi:serine/tyrosine/threonine adenylyltransferase
VGVRDVARLENWWMTEMSAPRIAEFSHSYVGLGEPFFARQAPTPVAQPRLVVFNHELGEELGVDVSALEPDAIAAVFAGNVIPEGADAIAMAYAGHQFGNFVSRLGDGRAILLGEVVDAQGRRRDIQLKGAGPTPYSRRGDGRAALGPVLREYLVSEAMAALGLSTTRALAAVTTGEAIYRERPLPGAVLTRVARSHIRVGTFQYLAARGEGDAIRRLADYVLDRLYPEIEGPEDRYMRLLDAFAGRQAALIARWLQIGFIHGVMNTDNMALSGETIDFGPCAFMDAYDPATVFSSIDQYGRYAYAQQAVIGQWNLARFAETILPLLDADEARAIERATECVKDFPHRFRAFWLAGMRAKIGLAREEDGDMGLIQELLQAMHTQKADFTLTFRGLCAAAAGEGDEAVSRLFEDPAAFAPWAAAWRARLARESVDPETRAAAMRRVNPAIIPRNQHVEAMIEAAVARDDFVPFHAFCAALANPYDDSPLHLPYAGLPAPAEMPYRTYCGT